MRPLVLLLTLCFFVLGPSSASAQWSKNYDKEIYSPALSVDGKHFAVTTDDDTLDVYDAITGKKLWSRPIKDYHENFATMFTNKGVLLVGADKNYYFLDAATGKELATFPIFGGDTWEDLRLEPIVKQADMDTIKPHFVDDIGIFFFDDGFQIVDLADMKLIHSSEASISAIKYEPWDNLLMINPVGSDSIYVIDTKERRMALKFEADNAAPNSRVYQHILVHNDQLLFMADDNILSFDLKTQKRVAIIDVDPSDPDSYAPVAANDAFYLMVSEDHKQKLYDAKSGAMVWETKPDVVPGMVEQVHYVDDKDAVVHTYHDDGKIGIYRLAMNDGKVVWSQIVAEQDGSYQPGYKRGDQTLAMIATVALQVAASRSRGLARDVLNTIARNIQSYNRQDRLRYKRQDRERWEELRKSVNKMQSSDGYVKLLEIDENTITLLCVGKLYNTLKTSDQKEHDGEGIVVLDSKTGKVMKHQNFAISAKNADVKNVIENLKTEIVGDAYVTVGYNRVCVVRGDAVEEIPFGESALSYVINDDKSLVFMVNENEDDEIYDYWRLDPSVNPSRNMLLARSEEKNVVFQPNMPPTASVSLNLTDDEIQGFEPIVGSVSQASFSSPKWKITEDDLGTLDAGNVTKSRSGLDSLNGVRLTSKGIYLLGTDRIGRISYDGKCRWAFDWEPNLLLNRMGVTEIGNTVAFSTGEDCQILKNTCEGGVMGKHEIDFIDATTLMNQVSKTVFFINRDDGIINCYQTRIPGEPEL